MTAAHKQLLFSDLDGLAFAAARGKLDHSSLPTPYAPRQLGPLLEFLQLSAGGRMPHPENWLALNNAAPLVNALEQEKESWLSPKSQHAGFIKATRRGPDGDSRLTGFLMTAKRAGRDVSGLPATVSGQLVAAMVELENNIHEHAEAPDSGLVAYRAEPGMFEFAVADRGIGVLRSLRRSKAYAALPDDGKALEAALTDGVSRRGPNSGHGHGFRPIFIGLVSLYGELRFRSGDHAITMDGTNPKPATARISQKAPIDGFFASVKCYVNPQ